MIKKTVTVLFWFGLLLVAGCITTKESTSSYKPQKSIKSERVDTLVKIAIRYIELGEIERAMQSLKEALKIDQRNPEIYEAQALVFQRTGEYGMAQHQFEQALKLNPKYTRARNNYAVFLYERGYYESACRQLEIVVQDIYYERRSDAFSNLGLCSKKINNLSLARKYYQRALLLNPHQVQSLIELAYLDFEEHDFSSAQKNVKEFHALVPKGTPQSLLLGYRLAKVFNQKIEAATYKKALKTLYPDSQEASLI